MEIRIVVDRVTPPQGRVDTPSDEGAVFSGWLDLLRVLQDALETLQAAESRGDSRA